MLERPEDADEAIPLGIEFIRDGKKGGKYRKLALEAIEVLSETLTEIVVLMIEVTKDERLIKEQSIIIDQCLDKLKGMLLEGEITDLAEYYMNCALLETKFAEVDRIVTKVMSGDGSVI